MRDEVPEGGSMTFEQTAANILVKVGSEKATQLAILAKLTNAETKATFEASAVQVLDDIARMVDGWTFDPPPGPGVPEAKVSSALALLNTSVTFREKLEKSIAKNGWNVQTRTL
jgi:hypothetical protein